MKKEEFYRRLNHSPIGSLLNLQWDRGNGMIERLVRFTGFDEKSPMLYFEGGSRLDIDRIGGYKSVISLEYFN